MSYTAPNWINGRPPAINATRLNNLCSTVQDLDETMPTKQDILTFDNTPRAGSSNPVKSSGIHTALQSKQNSLTFDSAPTQGSTNPVTSGGIYTAIQQSGGGGTITMDDVPTAGSSNPVKSSGIYNAFQNKQDKLTFDSTPTQGSTNPVTSGGVYAAIQESGALNMDDVPTAGSNKAVKSNGIYYHYIGAGRVDGSTVGNHSTAEGTNTTASGGSSHAEGTNTTASGANSHAEGSGTVASGIASHAEGLGTLATSAYQHVVGRYNISDTTTKDFIEIVGWGVTENSRANVRTLDNNGNMIIAGTLTQSSDSSLKTIEGEIPDVSGIHAVRFRWNDKKTSHDDIDHVGYIAQDVEKVAPFMVKCDSNGYKVLDYVALLCAKMELLERRVKELEEKKE